MNNMTPATVPETTVSEIGIASRWNMFSAAKNRLASHLDTNPGVLHRLARRENASVQLRVAENRNADSETLALLARHYSPDVRSAVAQNENTPVSTMRSLAADASVDVRYAMAENPWTSIALLEMLAKDDNPYVQHRARQTRARLKTEVTLSNTRCDSAISRFTQ